MSIDEAIQNLRLEMPFTKDEVERNYNILVKEYTVDTYENAEMFSLLSDAKELILDYLPSDFKSSNAIPNIKYLKKKKLIILSKLTDAKRNYSLEEGKLNNIKKELSDISKQKKHICKLANRILLLSVPSEQRIVTTRRRICFLLNAIVILGSFIIYHHFHTDIIKTAMLVMMMMAGIYLLSIIIASSLLLRVVAKYEKYNKQYHQSQLEVERIKQKWEKENFQFIEYNLVIQKYEND